MEIENKTRRKFVKDSAALALTSLAYPAWITNKEAINAYQAMGTRVGEISFSSAIVWARITATPERNNKGIIIPGRAQNYKIDQLPEPKVPIEELEGACPGIKGFVRLKYSTEESLKNGKVIPWVKVSEKTDFIHQFHLKNLDSFCTYYFESETTTNKNKSNSVKFKGKFKTAPKPDVIADIRFCLMTCQGYPDRGHIDGHTIYPSMLSLKPDFACLTGDLVYYDNDMPRAKNVRLARYHWERMFSLPRLIEFNRNVGTYWLKDDHDTLDNDSEPGAQMGEFTFAQGQQIFRQQAPLNDGPSYRTFRWGKDLQIWLSEGRDFRSPNEMPDGSDKTIWGKKQKEWFKKTVKESTATWKILVSPTPLVGPDRVQKDDNHSNKGFKHEGDELRNWLKSNVADNFFVICGDRHWQYHSVHPETGLHEFSIGAASDEHAGGTPGENKKYHRFHLVKGGFMSVDVMRTGTTSRIEFSHHDTNGKIVYKWGEELKF